MPAAYAPPELTKYSFLEIAAGGVGCLSPQNAHATCSCDCVAGQCDNIGSNFITGCYSDTPGASCNDCGGTTCQLD